MSYKHALGTKTRNSRFCLSNWSSPLLKIRILCFLHILASHPSPIFRSHANIPHHHFPSIPCKCPPLLSRKQAVPLDRKMTPQAQIDANRRNAQKSTGPATTEG